MSHSKILSTANNDFALHMYQALYLTFATDNLVFSPFGLHTLLGMVCQGAQGDTRTELLQGLQFKKDVDDETIANCYNHVITGFQKRAGPKTFTLLTASRIYCRTGFGLNRKFVNTLKTHFQADVEQLDMSTVFNQEVAAERINKWIKETTKNKIMDVIEEEDFDLKHTSLILVTGTYFKGFWKEGFNEALTSRQPFHTPTHQVNVEMMHSQKKFQYGELPDLKAEAVALPYRGGRLSMVIILPMDADGLEGLELQDKLSNILKGGKSLVRDKLSTSDIIELSLPRFKVVSLINSFEEWISDDLEIKDMFMMASADLSGISDGGADLHVSKVVQKVVIEVDEEGGAAGAEESAKDGEKKKGSGGKADEKKKKNEASAGGPIITIPFLVNRPFYFQVVDHVQGDLVIISGHVNDPTQG